MANSRPVRPQVARGVLTLTLCLGAAYVARSDAPGRATAATPQRGGKQFSTGVGDVYRRLCKSCHGTSGNGNGMRSSVPDMPDFTDDAWQRRRRDGHLLASILDGKGNAMPPFRQKLAKDEARDLVTFIREMGHGNGETTRPSASEFDEQFRQLNNQLEKLQKQYRDLWPTSKR
jgi:cytochrome c5